MHIPLIIELITNLNINLNFSDKMTNIISVFNWGKLDDRLVSLIRPEEKMR